MRAQRADTLALARAADPVPISEAVIGAFARLVRDCRAQGTRPKILNALIAATAIEHGLPVVTQDDDFAAIAAAHPPLVVRHVYQRQQDAYELIVEAAKQNIPVYFFNRGAGSARETVIFEGVPNSPANLELLQRTQLNQFRGGPRQGIGPEVADEEIVRAMMVVRLNIAMFGRNTGSPGLMPFLAELLNRRISPVVNSRGSRVRATCR